MDVHRGLQSNNPFTGQSWHWGEQLSLDFTRGKPLQLGPRNQWWNGIIITWFIWIENRIRCIYIYCIVLYIYIYYTYMCTYCRDWTIFRDGTSNQNWTTLSINHSTEQPVHPWVPADGPVVNQKHVKNGSVRKSSHKKGWHMWNMWTFIFQSAICSCVISSGQVSHTVWKRKHTNAVCICLYVYIYTYVLHIQT